MFVILGTLTVLGKLGGVWHGNWLASLSLALAVPFLWHGYVWLRWLVGGACVLSGVRALLAFGRTLADFDVPGESLDGAGVIGLVDVIVGFAFLFLPNVQAFFRYQRQGPLTGMARAGGLSSTLPIRRGSVSQLMAAGGWGLALGGGGGVLVSAQNTRLGEFDLGLQEVLVFVLVGAAIGGLLGVVAGLAVGAAQPKSRQSTVRLAVTRGLIAAGACVITMVVLYAIWGSLFGFHPAPIFGGAPPGWDAAGLTAVYSVIFLGLPVAVAGFVVGGAVAVLMHENSWH
ncbi:MAG TPA: hypothetical protein VNX28_15470 [Gemmataceae bacterium]|nr:hypothetical protein [Gemmataceae bacterium]